jgi:ethanolamine utilization cobalamin adenosyltransferase
MRARQKRPKTAVDQYLSILILETANFRRQLYELNKLRYRVRQAELSARNRAQAHSGARGRNPHRRPS